MKLGEVNWSEVLHWVCETCRFKGTAACGLPCCELERRSAILVSKLTNIPIREAYELLLYLL